MNKKRIIAPTSWSLLSDLHGGSLLTDKFIGQVQSGAVMALLAPSFQATT